MMQDMKINALVISLCMACVSACSGVYGQTTEQVLETAHLRTRITKGSSAGMVFREKATGVRRYVRFQCKGEKETFNSTALSLAVAMGYYSENNEIPDTLFDIDIRSKSYRLPIGISIKLSSRAAVTHLSAGTDEEDFSLRLPYQIDGSSISLLPGVAEPEFLHIVCYPRKIHNWPIDDIYFSDFMEKTTDPMEGLWTHYDINSSEEIGPQHRYTLGCVATSDGYSLYIIPDDDVSESDPLRLKAVLKRSVALGVYDLEWEDRNGNVLDEDNTAVFEDGILTLRFPAWDTSVRYVKQISNGI